LSRPRRWRKGKRPIPDPDVGPHEHEVRELTHVLETVQGKYGRQQVLQLMGMKVLMCDDVIQTAAPAAGAELLSGTLIRVQDYTVARR